MEKIAIVEDDLAVRNSLSFLLESAGLHALTFSSGERFLESVDARSATCVVADVRMPGMSGIDLLERCLTERPNLPFVLMTAHGDVKLAVHAMKLGATDFVEKPCADERIIGAVRNALARAGGQQDAIPRRSEIQMRLDSLSRREREVLTWLTKLAPNKVIARELGISARTVEIHRGRVMAKMEARSLADLVRMLISCGIQV